MVQPRVLIAGAGPTGLVLAISLNRQGIPVRIIDKNAGPGLASRAMVVHARTLEFYRQLGLADDVIGRGIEIHDLHLWDQGRNVADFPVSHFGEGLSPYPFVLSFPQDDHERLLGEKLREAGIAIEWNTELVGFQDDGGRVRAALRKGGADEICEVSYLCGCDGAHSTVRRELQLNFKGGDYEQVFFVADVGATGQATLNGLNMCLNVKDFCLVLPVRSTGMQRLIGIIPDELKDRSSLSFKDLQPVVEKLFGIRVQQVNWFSTYHVHHRVAEGFKRGRAFIAGDAGHIHSPAGGQGMNTGIGDAVNLAWKLANVLQGRADPSILDTYDSERTAFARTLIATTDRTFQAMVNRDIGGRIFRTFLLPHLVPQTFRFSAVRRAMFKAVSQIRINYRDSALSSGAAGEVQAGDRLPWVDYGSKDNYEPLNSLDWQVHVYGDDADPALAKVAAEHGLRLHVFPWRAATEKAGLKMEALYLIRPDGHVALATPTQDIEALEIYLSTHGLIFTKPAARAEQHHV